MRLQSFAVLLAIAVSVPPANDGCEGATEVLSSGQGSNEDALQNVTCTGGPDIFFSYTSTCDGTATADLYASTPKGGLISATLLASCGPLEFGDCKSSTGHVTLTVAVTKGKTYLFAVGSRTYRGDIRVQFTCASGSSTSDSTSRRTLTMAIVIPVLIILLGCGLAFYHRKQRAKMAYAPSADARGPVAAGENVALIEGPRAPVPVVVHIPDGGAPAPQELKTPMGPPPASSMPLVPLYLQNSDAPPPYESPRDAVPPNGAAPPGR